MRDALTSAVPTVVSPTELKRGQFGQKDGRLYYGLGGGRYLTLGADGTVQESTTVGGSSSGSTALSIVQQLQALIQAGAQDNVLFGRGTGNDPEWADVLIDEDGDVLTQNGYILYQ